MITTCSRLFNNWEQAVRAHLVDKLGDSPSLHVKTIVGVTVRKKSYLTIIVLASTHSNDEIHEDVFHENDESAARTVSPFSTRSSLQNSIRRVMVTMPDVEELSAPVPELPDLPAGWDERHVQVS